MLAPNIANMNAKATIKNWVVNTDIGLAIAISGKVAAYPHINREREKVSTTYMASDSPKILDFLSIPYIIAQKINIGRRKS